MSEKDREEADRISLVLFEHGGDKDFGHSAWLSEIARTRHEAFEAGQRSRDDEMYSLKMEERKSIGGSADIIELIRAEERQRAAERFRIVACPLVFNARTVKPDSCDSCMKMLGPKYCTEVSAILTDDKEKV